LQSRLDAWQQRRRLLPALDRLRRANDRLGPPPARRVLILNGLRCYAVCLLPTAVFSLFLLLLGGNSADMALVVLTVAGLNVIPVVLLLAIFTVHWSNAWGLAGRVANSLRVVLIAMLALYTTLILVIVATTGSWWSDMLLASVFLGPGVVMASLLVLARAMSSRPGAPTGPATFALHLALRFARWNYRRAVS
jgi:hypothetical protein